MGKKLAFKRVLLKLSGEVFGSEKKSVDFEKINKIASVIQKVRENTKV